MDKAKLGITRFFTGYFKNIHRLLLLNILFAVPLLFFGTVFYFISKFTGLNTAFITLAPIIFVYPFFAGITLCTRDIVKEKEEVPVVRLFFKGFKENFLKFIVHGILLYLAVFFCYSSVSLYYRMALTNGIFYIALGVAVLISVLVLFIFYNVPVMTVTFDLSLKDIYKNCGLISFGEVKNNFFATLGLFILFLFGATIFLVAPDGLSRLITIIAVSVLIFPSTASYIINFYVYKDMEIVISKGEVKSDEIKRKISEKENEIKKDEEVEPDFSALDLDERKDGEEYLYFNGKMIKRKVLIEMKKESEKNEQK